MFTQNDLEKVKLLCHIECSEEEQSRLLKNMQSILLYIDQLHEVNTDLTIGKHNPLDCASNILDEDIIEESLETTDFFDNSPSHVARMVKIPPLLSF